MDQIDKTGEQIVRLIPLVVIACFILMIVLIALTDHQALQEHFRQPG